MGRLLGGLVGEGLWVGYWVGGEGEGLWVGYWVGWWVRGYG